MAYLFAYGTLCYDIVQLGLFGRILVGESDCALGYRLSSIEIKDPEMIALSGESTHRLLVPTHNLDDQVKGMVFSVTESDLKHADAYEASEYTRKHIVLLSGKIAWVYLQREHP